MSDVSTLVTESRYILEDCAKKYALYVRVMDSLRKSFDGYDASSDVQQHLSLMDDFIRVMNECMNTFENLENMLNTYESVFTLEQAEKFRDIVVDKVQKPSIQIEKMFRDYVATYNIDLDDYE